MLRQKKKEEKKGEKKLVLQEFLKENNHSLLT